MIDMNFAFKTYTFDIRYIIPKYYSTKIISINFDNLNNLNNIVELCPLYRQTRFLILNIDCIILIFHNNTVNILYFIYL